jgi:hypothetical protein
VTQPDAHAARLKPMLGVFPLRCSADRAS